MHHISDIPYRITQYLMLWGEFNWGMASFRTLHACERPCTMFGSPGGNHNVRLSLAFSLSERWSVFFLERHMFSLVIPVTPDILMIL